MPGAVQYAYYPNGALLSKSGCGPTITYKVDGLSRVTKKDYSNAPVPTPGARFCYDGRKYEAALDTQDVPCTIDPVRAANGADYPEGALTDAVARDAGSGAIVSQTRYTLIDAQGRVTASVQKTAGLADMPFTYTYGSAGQLATVTYPSGRVVTYDLNGANRVKHVRNGGNYYLQSAGYKPDGSYTGGLLGTTGFGEIREYNSRSQSCGVVVEKAGVVAVPRLALQWKYSASDPDGVCEGPGSDNDGNLRVERVGFLNGGYATRSYFYDASNRITSYSEPSASQSFGYDAFGNLWQNGTAVGVPSLRATGPEWFVMPDGQVRNRLAGTAYDAAGNQTQLSAAAGTEAAYDGEGRVAQISISGVSGAMGYVYDAEGRRVKRVAANGIATFYVYDAGGELMAEYGGATPPAVSGTQYLVADHLGSTRLVLDAAGNCVARMDYAPFGGMVDRTGQECYGPSTPPASGVLFTGKERDGETAAGTATGLDYFGLRYMSAAQGRFTTPDPNSAGASLFDPQSWNGYSYVNNRPLNYVDPDGDVPIPVITGGVGAGVGALVGGGFEALKQFRQDGRITNWGKIGTAAGGGFLSGGLAGLTLGFGAASGAAAVAAEVVAVNASANVIGGFAQRRADEAFGLEASVDSSTELTNVALDAATGAAFAVVGGRVADRLFPIPNVRREIALLRFAHRRSTVSV